MKDGLTLTANDERRIEVLNRVLAGDLTTMAAAPLLGVSERQARRLLASYREDGPRGLIHGNRGRRPAHALSEDVRQQVVTLARERYSGVNHSHLAELLAERDNLPLARSTLSDLLRAEGIRSPRPQKRRSKHRSRRERYPREGMLLQVDASHHDWLESRAAGLGRFALLAFIDDATGKIVAARFQETEDARGYFLVMQDLCRRTGVPEALYSDKHSVFWPTNGATLQDQLAGRRSSTQFGRALQELGVALIAAHSPQAKGRIERLWGTLQDRLVSELRLAGIDSIAGAQAYLPAFIARFNKKFSVDAATPGSAYRPRLRLHELRDILCFKHDRVVSKDNVVGVDGVFLQILPGAQRIGYSKALVTVRESLDYRFSVTYDGRELPSKLLPLRKLLTPTPAPKRAPSPPALAPPATLAPPALWKPPTDHAWRKPFLVTKSLGT